MTTPCIVSTWTSKPWLMLSDKISDLTFVVIQLSEPSPSVFATALCAEPVSASVVNSSTTTVTPSTLLVNCSAHNRGVYDFRPKVMVGPRVSTLTSMVDGKSGGQSLSTLNLFAGLASAVPPRRTSDGRTRITLGL